MKKFKKGFTIVELVIVIAVIAVLTAVLVPTFIHLTNKANKASDQSLVTNLNKALAMRRGEGKEAPKTMHDAVKGLEEYGYGVEKLVTKSGEKLVYDLKEDKFYLDGESFENPYSSSVKDQIHYLWRIQDSVAKDAEAAYSYSVYASQNFVEPTDGVKVSVGFDAGDQSISKVTYSNTGAAQDVVIRTNSEHTKLEIDASKDEVVHYGDLSGLTISAVKGKSYHEYGTIHGNAIIASGHLVVEEGAVVGNIVVDETKKSEGATAVPTVKAESSSQVGTIVVNTVSEGTKVEVDSQASVGEIAPGNASAQAAMSNPEQSIATGKTVSETVIDTTNSDKFAGGFGTEGAPYLISSSTYWEVLRSDSELRISGAYFKVTTDLDFTNIDKEKQGIPYFAANIDFDGHKVSGLSYDNNLVYSGSYGFLFGNVSEGSISNLDFYVNSPSSDHTVKLMESKYGEGTLKFKNVNMYGLADVNDNNTGILLYMMYKGKVVFEDCTNFAKVYNKDGYTAAYVGRADEGSLEFDGCSNKGTIISISKNREAAIFVSNVNKTGVAIKVTDCKNEGSIFAPVISENLVYTHASKNPSLTGTVDRLGVEAAISVGNLSVSNGKFVVPSATDAARYELVFSFPGMGQGGGVDSRIFVLSAEELGSVSALSWKTASDEVMASASKHEQFGITYYIHEGQYVFDTKVTDKGVTKWSTLRAQPSVIATAYDALGNIIAMSQYNY